ncbi:hypothetical protein [Mesoterricola silvestris]|uniref:Uncharacterized protein n=1 Tax=Mesoterricola silvestris TaxID=2927979 RepID=A0AA48GV01_9BACT|nr:hypothetical protein [Mesoterricola silvestris]BDU72316.1 hypothetical protein METEAL_14900 [Mesoterricola silvestris]
MTPDPEIVTQMRKALRECREVLALCTTEPTYPKDTPEYIPTRNLCDRYGYGAVMAAASTAWMERMKAEGYPEGGAHTAGPCASTVKATLDLIDDTITASLAR